MTHPTPRVYRNVLAVLMGLLILTLAAAFLPFDRLLPTGHAQDWARRITLAIALTIALVKGLLIVLYFMHVRYAPRITWARDRAQIHAPAAAAEDL